MKTFMFEGYHFTPVGMLPSTDFCEITKYLKSQHGVPDHWFRDLPSYEDFYKTADENGCGTYDIFACMETGRWYMPGEHELFEYTGDVIEAADDAPERNPKTAVNITVSRTYRVTFGAYLSDREIEELRMGCNPFEGEMYSEMESDEPDEETLYAETSDGKIIICDIEK